MSNRQSQVAWGAMSLRTRTLFASLVAFFCLIGLSRPCPAQPSEVSYQGELKKDGLPFTGTAQMKFVVVDGVGESIWSNDGSSTSGSEPAVHVDVAATNGIFAIRLGATPMEPISGGLLKGVTEVALRVWVNTGDGFEQLTDQPISSSAFSLSGEKCLEIGELQINVVPRWDGSALTPGSLFDDGTNVGVGTNAPSTKLDVAGTVRSSTGGFQFPDGTLQTTAVTGGGGGVPSGAMILTDSQIAPGGYQFTGLKSLVSTEAKWAPKTDMPSYQYYAAACAVNGRIYVMGGFIGGQLSSAVNIYDPGLDLWSAGPPMPIARVNPAAVAVETKIYVLGGETTGSGNLDSMDELDTLTGVWTTKAPMAIGRRYHTAASLNGRVFAIGGLGQNEPLASVEAFDPASNTWTTMPDMPMPKQSCAAASIGSKIFVVGGGGFQFAFDETTNQWSYVAQASSLGDWTRAAIIDNRVYAIATTVSSLFVYDPALDYWTSEAPMPSVGSSAHCAVAVGNTFYLFSGYPRSTVAYTVPTTLYVHQRQ